MQGWQAVYEECEVLIDRLQAVRPLVIDYFLDWNESLRPIGKLMIAGAILECEAIWLKERANQNRRLILQNAPTRPTPDEVQTLDITKFRDDWCRFVIHKLVYGCSASTHILDNEVRFITFNYDTSLEYQLYRGLSAIDLLNVADVERFLNEERFLHVYGCVHPQIPTENDAVDVVVAANLGHDFRQPIGHAEEFGTRKIFLDHCLRAAENLRTIDPNDKEENEASLNRAKEWIDAAAVVYVLGYGFDRNNSQRIGMEPTLRVAPRKAQRSVMFTNYGDVNTINKKASRLFFGKYNRFIGESVYGDPNNGDFVEKSIRTVYDALELDFHGLEDELIAGSKI
jgi:hypothetical protein